MNNQLPRRTAAYTSGPVLLVACRVIVQACGLILLLVAARFLSQEELGGFALVSSAIILGTRISEAGWAEQASASVGAGKPSAEIFWGAIFLGALLVVILLISLLFLEARLSKAIGETAFILILTILPSAFAGCQNGLMIRNGQLAAIAVIQSLSEIAGTAVSVWCLQQAMGITALAYGRLASSVITLFATGLIARWVPFPTLSRSLLWECYLYSFNLVATRVVTFVSAYGAEFLIAIFLGLKDVGIFRVASRITGALAEVFSEPLRVMAWNILPYSKKSSNPSAELSTGVTALLLVGLGAGAPMFLLVAMNSVELVDLVLQRSDWADAAPVISVLCIARLLSILPVVNESFFTVANHSRWIFSVSIAAALINIILVVSAGLVYPGVLSIAFAQVLGSFLMLCLVWRLWLKCAEFDVKRIGSNLVAILIAAAVSGVAMFTTKMTLTRVNIESSATTFLLLITVGAIAYIACARSLLIGNISALMQISRESRIERI